LIFAIFAFFVVKTNQGIDKLKMKNSKAKIVTLTAVLFVCARSILGLVTR